ncbi:hypothetical protein FD881_17260 [Acinetobacter baumannii]|nr:hypothetical protein [Acinetobacter baumannii]NDM19825.1 hypothetical protein [Acinetobacter baumannii]NDX61024.1 hypothetical protein [Acinetobacter baumannii]PRO11272.1 hypothetical protein B9W31_17120 [Acinetobacter baumannii]PRO21332.1 hypothetical protein B9W69_22160 [Acinetobacter baumannii]
MIKMSEISVAQYVKRKEELERTLTYQLAELISKFEKDTGINVQDVYANFSSASCLGGSEKYFLTGVTVKTSISN